MVVSWLTVLKNVPWAEVISNAPAVAEAARKLWEAAARKSPPEQTAESSAESSAHVALASRIAELETTVSDLHGQMLASSELIKTLAEQNAQLIRRVETDRLRLLCWGTTTVITAIVAVTALYLAY